MSTGVESDAVDEPKPPDAVKASPILERQIWSMMNRQDDNWMGAVVGETGKGKSVASMAIAETVWPDMSIDEVAFGLVEFMELVNDRSYGRGSMVILEEGSVEAAAEDFHELSNKVLRTVAETWREQNRGMIINLPTFSRLDKPTRQRMTALIQVERLFEDRGFSVAKYKHLQTNSDTGELYRHYPRINGEQHRYLKLRRPSEDLLEAYKKKKEEYTKDLNRDLLEQLLEEQAEENEDEEKDPKRIGREILSDGRIDEYIQENHGQRYLSTDLIEIDYDIGGRRSKKVSAFLKREADIL